VSEIKKTYERLMGWIAGLYNETTGKTISPPPIEKIPHLEFILKAISGEKELPDGCPSRGSLAVMEISGIKKKLSEVTAAVKDLENAIWQKGK